MNLEKNNKEKKMKKTIIAIICIWIFFPKTIMAYNDTKTHPHLTNRAVYHSNLNNYLQTYLGLKPWPDENEPGTDFKGRHVTKLLEAGAEKEDKPMCRASNHFHNPYNPWDGLV